MRSVVRPHIQNLSFALVLALRRVQRQGRYRR